MPYIDQKNRIPLDPTQHVMMKSVTAGELNFQITRLADEYVKVHGGSSYATLNEVIGVLECAKLEFYRRIVSCYEDGKLARNGDVYENGQRS